MTSPLPVVLVRVPPLGGTARHRLTKREAAGGLFFGLAERYGSEVFKRYQRVAGELRFVAEPSKGNVGDGPAAARAVAALQSAGFEVRAVDEEAATRLRAGSAVVGGVVADADAHMLGVCEALALRGLAPRPYQIVGIRWLRATAAGALLDVMGLGKTMQVLLAMGDRGLVFCPSSVKGVWEEEAAKWRPDLTPVVCSGRGSFQWPDAGELVVINYDVIAVADVAAAGPCPASCSLAVDEGHVVKNGRTNRAKAIRAACTVAAKAGARRWLVTATPICNRPAELKAVLEAIGAFKTAFSSWSAFSRAFGGAIHSAEAAPTDDATQALARVSLRRTKDEVAADLPAVTFVTVPVKIEGQAAQLAAEIERRARPVVEAAEAEARLRGGDAASITAAIESALAATSEIGEMSAARKTIALAKYPAALAIVEACEAAGQPVLVVSAHREVCERFGEREGWGMIVGGVSEEERTRLRLAMQAGELKGLALTIRAGGVGLTLTRAEVGVAVDLEWNPSQNEQAFARNDPARRDRNDTAALHRACTWYLLRGDTWIEDRVHALTTAKSKMIDAVLSRVAELGGRVAAVPDLSAVTLHVARPTPVTRALPTLVSPPVRPGWIRDPALLARLASVATALPGGHVGRWLVKVVNESDGCLPPAVQGRGTRDLVAACERDAEIAIASSRQVEAERLFHARRPTTDRERLAAAALAHLAAADPDRATEHNGVGFSASTGGPGHRLAGLLASTGVLTDEEWVDACRIADHHSAQIAIATPLTRAA